MNSQKKPVFYYLVATAGLFTFLVLWQGFSKLLHRKAAPNAMLKLAVAVAKPQVATVKSYIEAVGQSVPMKPKMPFGSSVTHWRFYRPICRVRPAFSAKFESVFSDSLRRAVGGTVG